METSRIVRAVHRVRDAIGEMNYASRRMFELMFATAIGESAQAPDTYAEFLLRTSGVSIHEPPARRR